MAVSSISSSSVNQLQNSPLADFRQAFMQMVKAIKSGDLTGAQQAYATLSQLQANGQGPAAGANAPFTQALSQIGQDLQNGDLASAQQTLASLGQQAQASHHHHHHHHSASSDGAAAPTSASATAAPTSAAVDVVA